RAHTEIYTLSLHDALPILAEVGVADEPRRNRAHHRARVAEQQLLDDGVPVDGERDRLADARVLPRLARELEMPALGHHHQGAARSEEHTSELQSRGHLVCR